MTAAVVVGSTVRLLPLFLYLATNNNNNNNNNNKNQIPHYERRPLTKLFHRNLLFARGFFSSNDFPLSFRVVLNHTWQRWC
jgi:hypothetical protein